MQKRVLLVHQQRASRVALEASSPYSKHIVARARTRQRIFVIDDDEAVASMIGEMLRGMNYFSVVCTEPLGALSLFSRAPGRDEDNLSRKEDHMARYWKKAQETVKEVMEEFPER